MIAMMLVSLLFPLFIKRTQKNLQTTWTSLVFDQQYLRWELAITTFLLNVFYHLSSVLLCSKRRWWQCLLLGSKCYRAIKDDKEENISLPLPTTCKSSREARSLPREIQLSWLLTLKWGCKGVDLSLTSSRHSGIILAPMHHWLVMPSHLVLIHWFRPCPGNSIADAYHVITDMLQCKDNTIEN